MSLDAFFFLAWKTKIKWSLDLIQSPLTLCLSLPFPLVQTHYTVPDTETDLEALSATIECEQPQPDLYKYVLIMCPHRFTLQTSASWINSVLCMAKCRGWGTDCKHLSLGSVLALARASLLVTGMFGLIRSAVASYSLIGRVAQSTGSLWLPFWEWSSYLSIFIA